MHLQSVLPFTFSLWTDKAHSVQARCSVIGVHN